MKPPSNNESDVSATLLVSLPATYPKTLPRCSLTYDDGVRAKTRNRIDGLVKTTPNSLLGSEMMFELATSIQDILEDAVQQTEQNVLTLDEERAVQEAAAQQQARRAEEERLKLQKEAGAEEERLLSQMVEQEQARLVKSQSKPPDMSESPDIQGPQDGLIFDQQITTRDPSGTIVAFRAVHRKIQYRFGPMTEVFTVHPVGSGETAPPFLVLKECVLQASKREDKLKKAIQNLESNLETLISLNSHPSILNPLGFRIQKLPTESWSISILARLVVKGSLWDLLETVDTLNVSNVKSWTIQIIEGLDFYHRHGIVHAGLHLRNIFLERTETGTTVIKLSDGVYQRELHLIKEHLPSKFTSAASAYWTAPEVSSNAQGKISSPTDIWDLGVVLLHMLFGLEIQRQHASPAALMEALELSQSLDDFIFKVFTADPKKRPTAFDLLPYEFLRNDDPALELRASPIISRMTSSTSITPAKPARSRHDSTNIMASSSRYVNDFVEAGRLGRGGFGEVVRARNKLDGRFYAIKKVTQSSASALSGVLSEIILLSRLNHPNVVRYFTAWIEDEGQQEGGAVSSASETSDFSSISPIGGSHVEFGNSAQGLDFISSSGYPKIEFGYESGDEDQNSEAVEEDDSKSNDESDEQDTGISDAVSYPHRRHSSAHALATKTTLYIQMEYCEKQVQYM